MEIEHGRAELPWSRAHDWVTLSGVSAPAKALYLIYQMHLNRLRDDNLAWPGLTALAEMLGLSRADKITPLNRELEALGAIDIMRKGMPRRNVYVVHSTPPEGYRGPLTLKDWYGRNAPKLADKRAALAGKTERQRLRRSSSVTPDLGVLVTPKSGVLVTPDLGVEQEEVEPEEPNKEEEDTDVAPALTRSAHENDHQPVANEPKRKPARRLRTHDEEDAEVRRIMLDENGDDENFESLIDYLRRDLQVDHVDVYLQSVIDEGGPSALAALVEKALGWEANLGERTSFVQDWMLKNRGMSTVDALTVSMAWYDALAIRCEDNDLCVAAQKAKTATEYVFAINTVMDRQIRARRAAKSRARRRVAT
jgi:hypothetical protein